jgi:hypothetical protein
MDGEVGDDDATGVIRHVLAVLDALDMGKTGAELTVNTVSFLALLQQSEAHGDLLYASPEQARGERMDERSLVFSVGVLIFEKLTGRHPFGADGNPRRLARIQKAEMASGVAYFQTINGPLRHILLKCMGPFPEERWSSMAELRRELEAFIEGTSAPRRRRELPALPFEEEPTMILQKPASPKALSIAAEREAGRRLVSVAEMRAPAKSRWLGRAAWMGAGATAAIAAFLMLGRASASAENASPAAAPQPGPTAAPQPGRAAPTAPPVATGAKTRPTPAPTPEVSTVAAPVPASEDVSMPPTAPRPAPAPAVDSDVFDPELGGAVALGVVKSCFSEERRGAGLEIGVSLRYGKDGRSQRVFFGGGKLQKDERSCLSSSLVGLRAGGAPPHPVSVSYSFWLHKESGRVKTRLEQ